MMAELTRSYEKYFRQNRLPHLWCPGCGNGIVMKAIVQAIEKKGLTQDNTVIVSGIGCSSRASGPLACAALREVPNSLS